MGACGVSPKFLKIAQRRIKLGIIRIPASAAFVKIEVRSTSSLCKNKETAIWPDPACRMIGRRWKEDSLQKLVQLVLLLWTVNGLQVVVSRTRHS